MAGNEIRAYRVFLEKNGKTPALFIEDFSALEAFRPQLNHELSIAKSPKTYQVVRIDPPSNPIGQSVDYFVVELGTPSAPLRFTGMDSFGM